MFQVMLPDVLEQAFGAEVRHLLVGLRHAERPRCAVKCRRGAGLRFWIYGDIDARPKRCLETPFAVAIGCEIDAPFIAGLGRGFGRVSVGDVEAGDYVGFLTVGYRDVEPVVQKRIDLGAFA